jgi:hypothetical protein
MVASPEPAGDRRRSTDMNEHTDQSAATPSRRRTVRRVAFAAVVSAMAIGVGVAASDGGAPADRPASDRADIQAIAEWARANGLSGLSPASLQPAP